MPLGQERPEVNFGGAAGTVWPRAHAGHDHGGGVADGVQGGGAAALRDHAGAGHGEPGGQGGHPGGGLEVDVAAVAVDHLVHLLRLDAGALQGGLDGVCAQLIHLEGGKGAADLAHGGAGGADDNSSSHLWALPLTAGSAGRRPGR